MMSQDVRTIDTASDWLIANLGMARVDWFFVLSVSFVMIGHSDLLNNKYFYGFKVTFFSCFFLSIHGRKQRLQSTRQRQSYGR